LEDRYKSGGKLEPVTEPVSAYSHFGAYIRALRKVETKALSALCSGQNQHRNFTGCSQIALSRVCPRSRVQQRGRY
jgi:hypothetical protein